MTETSPPPSLDQSQSDPSLTQDDPTGDLIDLRNRGIEAALNPDGTLPVIKLENRPEAALNDRQHPSPGQVFQEGYANFNYAVHNGDGVNIGRALVHGARTDTGDVFIIDATSIGEGDKGKGYGRAIYKALIEGLPIDTELACDPRGVSSDALKVWEWLESQGVASHTVSPDSSIQNSGGYYVGLDYKTRVSSLSATSAVA